MSGLSTIWLGINFSKLYEFCLSYKEAESICPPCRENVSFSSPNHVLASEEETGNKLYGLELLDLGHAYVPEV